MTIKRFAAILSIIGACLLIAGATVGFGLPGGLIAGGFCLIAAGVSSL